MRSMQCILDPEHCADRLQRSLCNITNDSTVFPSGMRRPLGQLNRISSNHSTLGFSWRSLSVWYVLLPFITRCHLPVSLSSMTSGASASLTHTPKGLNIDGLWSSSFLFFLSFSFFVFVIGMYARLKDGHKFKPAKEGCSLALGMNFTHNGSTSPPTLVLIGTSRNVRQINLRSPSSVQYLVARTPLLQPCSLGLWFAGRSESPLRETPFDHRSCRLLLL